MASPHLRHHIQGATSAISIRVNRLHNKGLLDDDNYTWLMAEIGRIFAALENAGCNKCEHRRECDFVNGVPNDA